MATACVNVCMRACVCVSPYAQRCVGELAPRVVTSFRDPVNPVFAVNHVAAALQYEYNGVGLANLIEAIEVGNEVPWS